MRKIDFNTYSKYNPGISFLKFLRSRVLPGISILLMLFSVFPLKAQDTVQFGVKGIILNGSNLPVSNVSVAIEGSVEMPAFTNESGEFFLNVPTGGEWLNITPASGYKSKRVFINMRSDLTIYLTDEQLPSGFDQVGLLSRQYTRREMVASHAEPDLSLLNNVPVMSADQYLQGRTPGVHVINRSGDPGSGAVTLIRGINSINSSNQPLYLIDGMPLVSFNVMGSNINGYSYNPLLAINLHDISKITVIKDPVYSAAYGSKASNGIILIETLKPTATETVIDIDMRTGYSLSPAKQLPQLDAQQHKTLASEILFSSGLQEEFIKINYPNLFLAAGDDRFIDYQHNTNWQDIIFENSFFSNANINIKGGDEIARYGLSFGYTDAKGIIKSTEFKGYNLKFVSLLNIFEWLKMNADVNLAYNLANLKESARVNQTSPILTSLAKSPMLNPYKYDADGKELIILSDVDELGVSNPLAVIDYFTAGNNNFHIISTLGVTARPTEKLQIKSSFTLTYNNLKELVFMPNTGMETYYSNEAINVSKGANNSLRSLYNNTSVNYSTALGNYSNLSVNIGSNLLTNSYELDAALTKNAPKNDEYRMLQDGTSSLREISGSVRNWNWLSFYQNANYSYKDKYLVSLTLSEDGSSRLGENAKNTTRLGGVPMGIFYGAGIGWRLNQESFLKNIAWLEELKLRLSYGVSGNDEIGEANSSRTYISQNFRQTTGIYPGIIHNDKLSFERVSQLNTGLDFNAIGNRIRLNLDLYKTTISDMLIFSPVEAYMGYDYRPENNGTMENKGIDLGLFTRIIDRPLFKWDLHANLSYMANQVTKLEGGKFVTPVFGAEVVNMEGETANSFYGYKFKGVYATTEEAQAAGLSNNRLRAYGAGDAIFEDLSGPGGTPDGIINNYDKTALGSSLPDFFGGVTSSVMLKRWTVNLFVQFVNGNEIYNYLRYQNESMTGLSNQSRNVLNRWQYEGQETQVPRAFWQDPAGNADFSSRWIEDGSFIRLKTIYISYSIPKKILAFRNAEFYVTGSNLFTMSSYLGYDPEFGYSHLQIEQGIDYGMMPNPRQFIFGIKLGL